MHSLGADGYSRMRHLIDRHGIGTPLALSRETPYVTAHEAGRTALLIRAKNLDDAGIKPPRTTVDLHRSRHYCDGDRDSASKCSTCHHRSQGNARPSA